MGANIASLLSSQGLDVIVLDIDGSAFSKLSPKYSGFTAVADATDIDELINAGIERADVVISATDNDNKNLMIAQIASKIFNVPKVISQLFDSEKEIVCRGLNIQFVYPTKLSTIEFENLISQNGELKEIIQ